MWGYLLNDLKDRRNTGGWWTNCKYDISQTVQINKSHCYTWLPDGSVVKDLPAIQQKQETLIRSLNQEDPLEEEMVTHSRILA